VTGSHQPTLDRKLGPIDAAAVVVANVVGVGIFMTPGIVAAMIPNPLALLSVWVAGGVLVIVRLGTVIPNAPGNLGLIQVACVVALRLFDVENDTAKTFSFVMFFALTLPLLIGGAVATALTGLNIGELRDRAQRGAIAVPHDA